MKDDKQWQPTELWSFKKQWIEVVGLPGRRGKDNQEASQAESPDKLPLSTRRSCTRNTTYRRPSHELNPPRAAMQDGTSSATDRRHRGPNMPASSPEGRSTRTQWHHPASDAQTFATPTTTIEAGKGRQRQAPRQSRQKMGAPGARMAGKWPQWRAVAAGYRRLGGLPCARSVSACG